ncbi:MAG: efflux RND transporter permease subunit [Melioribacter sp.]|nr:efflux RND transporter permease subunit [Melioribacter sp.]
MILQIAFVLTFLVIYFFQRIRILRGSVIMGISIPISIIATFDVMFLVNITLNIISITQITLAMRMFVDI